MKKLSTVVITLLIIIGITTPAAAWKIKQGPCMSIKINMSEEYVKMSALKVAILIKAKVLDIYKIDKEATGLCLMTRPSFDPWGLKPKYVVGLVIHALRIRQSANIIVIGIDATPLFIFTYNHTSGILCCEGVTK